MKLSRLILFTSLIIALNACNLGFDLEDTENEGEENDNINGFRGPSQNASWELDLSNSGTFTLSKRSDPGAITDYDLLGNHERLSSGFLELTITTSPRPSEVPTTIVVGLELDDTALILFPFEQNASELIALVPENDCPANDVAGNWLYFDSDENAADANTRFLGTLLYSASAETVRLSSGIALTNGFPPQNEISLDQVTCSNGFDELTSGDQYLSSTTVAIEDRIGGYKRLVSIPQRTIAALADVDGMYVGFARKYSQTEDTSYATAECSAGECDVFFLNDYTQTNNGSQTYSFDLDEDSLNNAGAGIASGEITQIAVPQTSANIACIINTDLTPSGTTTKVLACNAQAPDDTDELLNFFFVESSG